MSARLEFVDFARGLAIIGVVRRNWCAVGIACLSAGAFLFLALVSHFISRYSAILVPNALIALSVLTVWGIGGLRTYLPADLWALEPMRRFKGR